MTRKEFKKDISHRAKTCLSKHGLRWQDVEIDAKHSIISIGTMFYAQGESADMLIEIIPDDINARSFLLYYLDSAGVL